MPVVKDRITYDDPDNPMIGTTMANVTVDDRPYGRDFSYPVIRCRDLTDEARERLVNGPHGLGSVSAADKALEAGVRYKLSGALGNSIRKGIVAPSDKQITKALQTLVCDLMGSGDMPAASDLNTAMRAADRDGLIELWENHLKISADD